MLHMKKVLFLTILFLAGFVAGVVTMEIVSRSAQRVRAYRETLHAYKEILQRNFVNNRYKAFKEGNNLKAMVHLYWLSKSNGIRKNHDCPLTEVSFFLG